MSPNNAKKQWLCRKTLDKASFDLATRERQEEKKRKDDEGKNGRENESESVVSSCGKKRQMAKRERKQSRALAIQPTF